LSFYNHLSTKMESVVQENPATERSMVEAPTVESIEAPREGLQEQYEERQDQQEPVSAIDAPPTSTSLQEGPEQGVGPAAAKDSTTTESARGGAAGKGKGRGGGRSASTASAKGKGASAGKGTAARGGGKAGASTSARGGAKGGRASTSKGGAKGGKGSAAAKSKDLSSNNAEGSGNGSIEGTSGIGSGPSNTIFPLARVSRIVKVDKEIEMTSKDAIWTIAVATELFIKHLTDSAYAKARLDKKKTITFKELSSAVESQNEFFFLQGEFHFSRR
jgi:histone H3/H4